MPKAASCCFIVRRASTVGGEWGVGVSVASGWKVKQWETKPEKTESLRLKSEKPGAPQARCPCWSATLARMSRPLFLGGRRSRWVLDKYRKLYLTVNQCVGKKTQVHADRYKHKQTNRPRLGT